MSIPKQALFIKKSLHLTKCRGLDLCSSIYNAIFFPNFTWTFCSASVFPLTINRACSGHVVDALRAQPGLANDRHGSASGRHPRDLLEDADTGVVQHPLSVFVPMS